MADTIKKNLLAIVQEILKDINEDNVNSISDTDAAYDVAQLVQSTYFDMVTARQIPDVKEVIQLTGLADSTRPTYLLIPDYVSRVDRLDYNVSTVSGTTSYRTLDWLEPDEFLDRMMSKDTSDTTTQTMASVNSAATFVIKNNKMPTCYTSFDNKYIVCDAFDSTEESTLQTTNTRAYVSKIPNFTLSDTFIPEISESKFRVLVNEAKSMASAVINRALNPKLEQAARKSRMLTQNDKHRIGTGRSRANFGRT